MDWNNVKQLLEKYYNAETTVLEEQLLKSYFQRDDIPNELKADAKLFSTYQALNEKDLNDFKPNQTIQFLGKKSISMPKMIGIAASFLLLSFFGIQFLQQSQSCKPENVLAVINNEPICDEEIAKQKAMEALQLISSKMNQGTKNLDYIKALNTPQIITSKK